MADRDAGTEGEESPKMVAALVVVGGCVAWSLFALRDFFISDECAQFLYPGIWIASALAGIAAIVYNPVRGDAEGNMGAALFMRFIGVPGLILLAIFFLARGVAGLAHRASTQAFGEIYTVSSKSFQRKPRCYALKFVELKDWMAEVCVDEDSYDALKSGDKVFLMGRKSWFGREVESFAPVPPEALLPQEPAAPPTAAAAPVRETTGPGGMPVLGDTGHAFFSALEFLEDDLAADKVRSTHWLTLCREAKGTQLADMLLGVAEDGEGGVKVTTPCGKPLGFVSGAGLAAGAVEDVTPAKGGDQDALLSVHYGAHEYLLQVDDDGNLEFQFDENPDILAEELETAHLQWAGDLNRDGLLDMIINASQDANRSMYECLYLSTAKPAPAFRPVACTQYTGG